ncbi:MAG: GNAT family N-acetyltransferase [Bacteroidetes bacterium]|nr:GNAT family N-acetyltransferase [Bacteroidota bacterium]
MTNIRPYKDNDAPVLITLFTETVRRINISDYTPEQIAVWAPKDEDAASWRERFVRCMTLVAEDERGIAGFGQLEVNGHIDCFYVAHDRIGSGVGSMLLRAIEQRAHELGIGMLHTEASITARPFFARRGFRTVQEQSVARKGIALTNFSMEKDLG